MKNQRGGVVLLIVLVVVAMLALGAYSFVQLMNTEARAAQMYGRQVQAREAAESGVHYVAAILLDQKFNGMLGTDMYDASSMFNGQLVTDESETSPRMRCRFSVVAPMEGSGNSGFRFGVIDESGKININALAQRMGSQQQQGSQTGNATGGGNATGTGTGTGTDSGTGDNASNPLLYLPKMTEDIADAILDWIDSDDSPRQNGAESEYYQSLSPPYQPRNGPMHTLDELLLVAGVTPRLLYGEDANMNGVLDPNEDDGDLSSPNDDSNGTLDRGWLQYLTLFSHETNKDVLGTTRIYINNQDLDALYDQLSQDSDFGEEKARFIIAYRLFGAQQATNQQSSPQDSNSGDTSSPSNQSSGNSGGSQGRDTSNNQQSSSSQGSQGGSAQPGGNSSNQSSGAAQPSQGNSGAQGGSNTPPKTIAGMDASGGATQQIKSVIDLVDVTVNVKVPGQQNTTPLKSPFLETDYDDFLDMLLDRTTTDQKKDSWGRINVNTAPLPALMSLPGMTEGLGDAIVAARGSSDASNEGMSNLGVAWLLTNAGLTKQQFKTIEPYITGQSQVFRVQVVGFYEEGGPQARIEAVIDLSGPSPRFRYWRDLTGFGRGFDRQELMGTVSR